MQSNNSDGTEQQTTTTTEQPAKRRGFAAMDPAKVRAIAALGGRAAHANGTAHRWTKEEAIVAGRKGGIAPHVRRGRGPCASEQSPTQPPPAE